MLIRQTGASSSPLTFQQEARQAGCPATDHEGAYRINFDLRSNTECLEIAPFRPFLDVRPSYSQVRVRAGFAEPDLGGL